MIISLSGNIKNGKDEVGSIIQYLTSDFYPLKSYQRYKDKLDSEWGPPQTNFEIKKFADKLKDCTCLLLGCTREQLEDREFRDKPLGEEWWYYKFDDGIMIPYLNNGYTKGEEPLQYLVKLTPRLLLQLLGTEAGRNIIHPNIWVNSLMSEYKINITQPSKFGGTAIGGYPNWIITDNRFPNEIQVVKSKQGITIRIERDFNLRFPEYNNIEEVKDKDPELYKQLTHFSETAVDDYKEWDYVIQNNGTIEDLIEEVRNILIKESIL